MKKIIAALLLTAILFASVSALAADWIVVAIDGSTYIRLDPSIYAIDIGVLERGHSMYATGDIEYDNRGVAWYQVYVYYGNGITGYGWVSSRYTDLRYR